MLSNKYSRVYDAIINRAKARVVEGYSERHHIIPEALGGPNTKDNIVRLTAREHFVCHQLLVKFTDGDDRRKMANALWFFLGNKKHRDLSITARKYEMMKKLKSEAMSKPQDPSVTAKIAASNTGKKRNDEQKTNLSVGQTKHYASESVESKIARQRKGTWGRVKTYKVQDTSGSIQLVTNIQAFSAENGIKGTALYKTEGRKSFTNGYRIVGRV